jgi:WD40 repeat protein
LFIAPEGSEDKSTLDLRASARVESDSTIAYVGTKDQNEWHSEPGRPHIETPRQDQVGRFRVVRVLGQGAFGTVYRAFDPLLDREVALKVPRFVDDDPALRERFLREAKAAARLRNPNIVAVFESGQSGDNPFIVSEFVDGVPLAQVLRKQRPELRTAVDWVRLVAEAIDYAHGEGVVHRDIKPSNIMINRAGRPLVMDFGLARRSADDASRMTLEGHIIGTPAYMAPEQARGQTAAVGPLSDQYSVGVVLYELLCGRTPFMGSPWSVMSRVGNLDEAPPTPRALRPDIPRDLEACCLKALEKEPAARYASLKAFAEDLERWHEGQPLVARPIGAAERLIRWCRKNRLIAGLAGVLLALAATVAVAGYLLAFQFEQLADKATHEADEARTAREKEKTARLATDQLLIDTYTETGLTADRNGDPHEAILWFANAAARAEFHPLREQRNRGRVQAWLSEIAIPVDAFEPGGGFIRGLHYHPTDRCLLIETEGGDCQIHYLEDGSTVSKAGATCSLWTPDGKARVQAAGDEVSVFSFPEGRQLDRWQAAGQVTLLAISGDGQWLAVADDRAVQLRSLLRNCFATPPLPMEQRVRSVALSRNGRHVAVRCADQQVRVFSAGDARVVIPPQPSTAEGKDVPPIFLDERRLVIMDSGKSLACWDVAKGELLWKKTWPRSLALAAAPDGKLLAAGAGFDAVLLDAGTGEAMGKPIAHRNHVTALAFDATGTKLLSGSADYTARVSLCPSGEPALAVVPHHNTVAACAWSPDGRTFATALWGDPSVRIWKHRRLQTGDFAVPAGSGNSLVKFSRDGKYFFASQTDTVRDRRALQVHDASTGERVGKRLEAAGLISDATFVPGTALAVLAGSDSWTGVKPDVRGQDLSQPGIVEFLNHDSGIAIFAPVKTPSNPVAVEASPDGRTIVVLCHLGQVLLFDASTGKLRAEQQAFKSKPADHGYVIRDRVRFAPDGQRFVIWGCGPRVEMREAVTGALLFELVHQTNFIHDVRFAPNGSRFATCSSDMTVRLWSSATGEAVGTPLPHSGWVFTAQFTRDGRRLLTASQDRQAHLWDVDTGRAILTTVAQSDEVYAVCFTADEELFFIGTRDGRVSAWDARLGSMVAPTRKVPSMVYQLALTPNGTHVMVAGRLTTISAFALDDWLPAPDNLLPREDVRLLGEIVSSRRIHEGGAATSLSKEQWLERWQTFKTKYPQYPLLRYSAAALGNR